MQDKRGLTGRQETQNHGLALQNKRGMFFTLLVITLISLFFLVYTSYSSIDERRAIEKRIETMNNFIFSLEKDMSRQIYISGYRAMISLQNYITNQGSFITNSSASIREALLNGTISNKSMSLMEGYRLEEWNSRVSDLASKVNLLVNYSLSDVKVSQEDPWHVKIDMLINITIWDKSNLASWHKIENISSKIEIVGFEDPFYLINTNGKIPNKINRTIYQPFVNEDDVSNLSLHVQNSYYMASSQAPSYLDRLEGRTTSNPEGIESLVYLPELSAQGIEIEDKSVVDYIYFSSQNPVSHNIQGMPSWFKIDDAHLDVYGISHLIG